MRWLQKLHFCAVFVSGLMNNASYGQAFMHDLQPMQLSSWKSTTPLSARNSAFVGQMVMHGASSHWLQRITEKCRLASGNFPVSMYFTQVRLTPKGTSCSLLHAMVHA